MAVLAPTWKTLQESAGRAVHRPAAPPGKIDARQICVHWPREQRPHRIAMTANAMQGDREMCLAAGMDDSIIKPIRIAGLAAGLERVGLSQKREGKQG